MNMKAFSHVCNLYFVTTFGLHISTLVRIVSFSSNQKKLVSSLKKRVKMSPYLSVYIYGVYK